MTAFEKPLSDCTIAIAGLGLMGGSLGLALRGQAARVVGIARRAETIDRALEAGAIDQGCQTLAEGAGEADIVVLATPVSVILAQIEEIDRLAQGGEMREGALVIDLGSTKAQICAALDRLPATLQPVGGHPMCGKESSGLDVAEAGLYEDAPFVLIPLPRTARQATALATHMALAVGACPIELEPVRHDRLVAGVSHVPYLAALAVFAAAGEQAQADALLWRLAAGGFRSTTRLAGSEEKMMADILLSNRASVLAQLDRVQAILAELATLIAAGDEAQLRAMGAAVRQERAAFLEQHRQ